MWRLKVAEGGGNPWLRTVNNHVGRQVWEFDPDFGSEEDRMAVEEARANFTKHRSAKKHSSDLLMRMQLGKENPCDISIPHVSIGETEDVSLEAVTATLQRALKFYSTIQAHDGHWPGDYGGPMFLMPGLVIVLYVTGALHNVLSSAHIQEMCRYLYNHQNEDGGWGLHIEGHSTMFCTALSYVTLRLLGERLEGMESCRLDKAQKWILDHGSVTAIPSWGKMWLSVLGVYDWSGNNPLPPEIWLLPYFIPLHPGRMWCHCRMVYLPMCFLYGMRFVGRITETVLELRNELLSLPYDQVDWNGTRNLCAKEDLYYPHPLIQDIFWATLHKIGEPILMHWPGSILRKKSLHTVMQHIHYEDENTRYICIGPVNKVLNMLCCWVEDPNSEAFTLHLARIPDYLWVAEDGMKMKGYNGSQLWDTAFAVQSIISAELFEDCDVALRKAHDYIKNSQVLDDCPGDLTFWYRHISKGAWPFSTADHGWPISDCTAEGLKAALLLSKLPSKVVGEPLAAERLYDAVNVILSLQNSGGGFATYELTRSYEWLELINPAETFGDIVIDYPYVECTSAAVQALTAFRKVYPGHRKEDIKACISKGVHFIQKIQLPDGSWYGSWGVCFTYGLWFGVKGLVAGGMTYQNCFGIRKACEFLLAKQLPSGGWGESYLSSQDKLTLSQGAVQLWVPVRIGCG
ncbi:cycloartenol synthase 2-like isoform X2 [Nymphaea colorata]|uniref:cycloartenol synthase 2-like isoform X2 n=1 Tax=Nymphaea colorata TaxID=210225 RepID=UPI00129EA800|nr:cycloartenol synthase 2-like isoform X2 [Nymphaea colorata]XP_031504248.1 cycloartenol synthase 2-like isoform X2 [Nymphaea colorata]XP_031504249.1 cycloartenol synthase 2-like isoform X2 [Nymphaea colorata]